MDYDELVHSKDIQILKSMLPFIDRRQQMPMAIMIQFIEFQKVIQIFKNTDNVLTTPVHNAEEQQTAMLQALIKHFSTEEQETMNNMMNMMNMMSMMNTDEMMQNYENFM